MGNITLGSRIKNARKAKGYTQKYLADLCGVSQQTISLIERDKYKSLPHLSTLKLICNALDIAFNDLLDEYYYIKEGATPLATAIKNARMAKGYSQSDLSSLCGISSDHISRIECGSVTPYLSTLELICKALEISLDELLKNSEYRGYDSSIYLLGSTIRNARKAKGYTQEDLSNLSGVCVRALSVIENGQIIPHMSTLKKLCDALSLNFKEVSKLSKKG